MDNLTLITPDYDAMTLSFSPTSALPPAYTCPVEPIGDEPSHHYSEKSAPPPYAAADPEPCSTRLLDLQLQQRQRADATAQRVALKNMRRQMKRQLSLVVSPRRNLRTAPRTAMATRVRSDSTSSNASSSSEASSSSTASSSSNITFRLVGTDGSSSRVPELITPDECTDSDSGLSEDALEEGGADQAWLEREELWSTAGKRLVRRSSMSNVTTK